MKSRIAEIIATWFYAGRSPKAPGTVGSVVALAVAYFVPVHTGLLAALLLAPGIWAAGEYAKSLRAKDPQDVVVDEVLGQWIALGAAVHTRTWKPWLLAFVLFRLFDIVKPPPVRQLERLPGGYGIVLDDVMAGIFAAVVMRIAGWNNLY